MPILLDVDGLNAFLEDEFPQALSAGFLIDAVTDEGVRVRLPAEDKHLRPGGTVMGPTLMMLADTAAYLAILSRIGPVGLAVTTSLEIHFLRKAPPGELVVEGRILKLGSRLAVVTVVVRSDALEGEVAHATVTYSIPPR